MSGFYIHNGSAYTDNHKLDYATWTNADLRSQLSMWQANKAQAEARIAELELIISLDEEGVR